MSATSDAWPIFATTDAGQPLQTIWGNMARHGVYRIADTAERATLIAALAAAGLDTTVVYAHRLDAAAGFELERTIDGGTSWRPLAGGTGTPGSYTLASYSLDGTTDPALFTESVALSGVSLSSGLFTFDTPGVYAVNCRITTDDGTADTGHDVSLVRNSITLARDRRFAPAGGTGLGQVIGNLSWVGRIADTNPLKLTITTVGTGGRSSVSAAMTIERIL